MDAGARLCLCFFFEGTATTEIYTLSLHDALPISDQKVDQPPELNLEKVKVELDGLLFDVQAVDSGRSIAAALERLNQDRKSTRLNSSHPSISYAVFCLKKKKKTNTNSPTTTQQQN